MKFAIALLLSSLISLSGIETSFAKAPAKLITSSAAYQHGQTRIRITQSRPSSEDNQQTSPRYCRASMTVDRKGQKSQQFNYSDISPNGFSYGLFVPSKPVYENYFIVVKEGDYDGIMYLIHKNGKVHKIPGGYYMTDPKRHLLFITHATDCNCGAAVFSLTQGKVLHQMDAAHIQQWYRNKDAYFFTTDEWDGKKTVQGFYRYDAKKGKFIHSVDKKVNHTLMSQAVPVQYDFDPTKLPDCQVKP